MPSGSLDGNRISSNSFIGLLINLTFMRFGRRVVEVNLLSSFGELNVVATTGAALANPPPGAMAETI